MGRDREQFTYGERSRSPLPESSSARRRANTVTLPPRSVATPARAGAFTRPTAKASAAGGIQRRPAVAGGGNNRDNENPRERLLDEAVEGGRLANADNLVFLFEGEVNEQNMVKVP